MTRSKRQLQRGYTLAELMLVVVIAGVLVTLAVFGVRKYIYTSKTAEATGMLASIAAAEETYKDETGAYLQASSTTISYYPQDDFKPKRKKYNWINDGHADWSRWNALNVRTSQPVQFGYVALAGLQSDPIPSVGTAKDFSTYSPDGPWTLLVAAGDQDGDGTYSYFVLLRAGNIASAIHREAETE